jgi:hypothetical protein
LDDVEADTPLEQRLLVDQDLFREKNNNLKTYSRRRAQMNNKFLHIHLERCDNDDYDNAVPLQEISLDETSPRGNGRSRRCKIQADSPSPKKRRVSVRNDENASGLVDSARRTRKKSSTDAVHELPSSPEKITLVESAGSPIKSPKKSPIKELSKLKLKRRNTRSSSQLGNWEVTDLVKPAEVTCSSDTKSPQKNEAEESSNKSVEESTPESSVFKTPVFPTSGLKRSSRNSVVSYADVTSSSLDVTTDCDESSDDDTSWNDSLECLELPNQLLELTEQPQDDQISEKNDFASDEEDLVSAKDELETDKDEFISEKDVLESENKEVDNKEESVNNKSVQQIVQDMSVGTDSTLDSTCPTSEDDDEGFEYKKGAPVLAKVGNWPHWPSFVVPYHGCYRTGRANFDYVEWNLN